MATAVTISIVVDSAQAQQALTALNSSLAQTGTNASVGFQKAGAAVQQLGGHSATSLDAVRLLSQEFGLRLPRAIEAMISRSQGLSTAIQGVVGGLAAIAAVEVFVHLAKEAYDLYHNYISLNAAADKYYETLQKTRESDFGGARTIETQTLRFQQATQVASQLRKQANDLHDKGFDELTNPNNMNPIAGTADLVKAREIMDQSVKADQARDAAAKNGLELTHQQAVAQIELTHATDGELVGRAKINAELAKKLAMNKEDRQYGIAQEKAAGNVVSADSGLKEQQTKDAQAKAEASSQNVVLNRDAALAIMKANDEVVQAGLEGDALETRKKLDSIREITQQLRNQDADKRQIAAETAAIEAKLDNERAERLEKQMHDAQQAQRTASQSGLTGAARVNADFGNRLDQINSDRSLDPAAAAQLRIAAKTEEDQKLKELSDNFTANALATAETRSQAELGGLQKIEAEAQRAIATLQKAYDLAFKDDQGGDRGTAKDRSALASAKSGILEDETRQRKLLADQNNAEDLQYAQEAARAEARVKEQGVLGWVAAYKNGIAEINAEDQRRTAQMQEQAAKQGATQEQIAARKVEIDRTANAQIAEQNLQMQHQIAGDLQSAFTNPVQFIKSAMEKMFFEIIASWVMKMHGFQAVFGNTMGGLQPGSAAAGGGGVAGTVAGAGGLLAKLTHGAAGAFNAGTPQGSYTSAGGAAGGGTIGSGSTSGTGGPPLASSSAASGGGIGSTLTGIGSLAQTALNIPGLGGAFGSSGSAGASGSGMPASSGLTYNDSTGQFDNVADPSASSTLANVPGFGGSMDDDGSIAGNDSSGPSLGGYAAAGMGAFQGVKSTMNTFEGGSVVQGMVGDAEAGAAIGMLAGPEGALIGAGIGAAIGGLAGIFGLGAKGRARNYYKQSIRPQLDQAANNTSYGDFQTAIANVNTVSGQGLFEMKNKFGNSAGDWVNDHYMKKYVQQIDSMITTSATGGRQFTQLSAMQFHTGGTISGFGSFRTSDDEGYIHAKMGETVMTPGASSSHGPMLSAMNAGASAADIATAYLANSGAAVPAQGGGGGDTHFHVHTLDTKTMTTWLRGGGAKMITNAQNNYSAQYAGDGIG